MPVYIKHSTLFQHTITPPFDAQNLLKTKIQAWTLYTWSPTFTEAPRTCSFTPGTRESNAKVLETMQCLTVTFKKQFTDL